MKTSAYISSITARLPRGYVFTYLDFINKVNSREAVIKALNRMAASGKIVKLAKGKFYKPEYTTFGKLQPRQNQIVKDLLESDGKLVGYLTGYSIYNQLGLTTQVSNTIQIGKNEIRPAFKRNLFTISFIRQKNIITRENIPLLQILDAIRYIKKIPGTNLVSVCKRLIAIVKDLESKDKSTLVRLALKYPPATRALVGALLDKTGKISLAEPLKKSLNPISTFKLSGVDKILPAAEKWNFK